MNISAAITTLINAGVTGDSLRTAIEALCLNGEQEQKTAQTPVQVPVPVPVPEPEPEPEPKPEPEPAKQSADLTLGDGRHDELVMAVKELTSTIRQQNILNDSFAGQPKDTLEQAVTALSKMFEPNKK